MKCWNWFYMCCFYWYYYNFFIYKKIIKKRRGKNHHVKVASISYIRYYLSLYPLFSSAGNKRTIKNSHTPCFFIKEVCKLHVVCCLFLKQVMRNLCYNIGAFPWNQTMYALLSDNQNHFWLQHVWTAPTRYLVRCMAVETRSRK